MEITPEFIKSQIIANAIEEKYSDMDFRDNEEKLEVILSGISIFLDQNLSEDDWQFIALTLLKIVWSNDDCGKEDSVYGE